jgi:hypothetical protein
MIDALQEKRIAISEIELTAAVVVSFRPRGEIPVGVPGARAHVPANQGVSGLFLLMSTANEQYRRLHTCELRFGRYRPQAMPSATGEWIRSANCRPASARHAPFTQIDSE